MSKVFSVGVFDLLHYGHIRLFKKAHSLACKDGAARVIIAVQSGRCVRKYKPDANLVYSTKIRAEMIRACKYVDEVVIYDDVDSIVRRVDFDIFIVGEDQRHDGFKRAIAWAKANGKKVVRLKRSKGISSSALRERKQ